MAVHRPRLAALRVPPESTLTEGRGPPAPLPGMTAPRNVAPLRIVLVVEDTGPCDRQAVLSQPELDIIDALPDGAHETGRELSCELEAGHPGPHLALAQAYGDPERSRWLQWEDKGRGWLDIEDTAHCDAEGPSMEGIGGENAMCLLPGTHPGRHSFEFGVIA